MGKIADRLSRSFHSIRTNTWDLKSRRTKRKRRRCSRVVRSRKQLKMPNPKQPRIRKVIKSIVNSEQSLRLSSCYKENHPLSFRLKKSKVHLSHANSNKNSFPPQIW